MEWKNIFVEHVIMPWNQLLDWTSMGHKSLTSKAKNCL